MKHTHRAIWIMIMLGMGLIPSGSGPSLGVARAQPVPAPDEKPELHLRFYDVGDLIHSPVNQPLAAKMVSPTQLGKERQDTSFPPAPPPPPRGAEREDVLSAETLQKIMRETIAPDTWADAGGLAGMRVVENMLLVRQTAAVHRQVEEFLEGLRNNREAARMVTIHADWLALGPEELAQVLKRDQTGTSGREVDASAVEKLGRKVVFAHGVIACAGGQTVHLISGRVRTVVQGLDNAVGTGSASFQPDVDELLSGAALQVTPHVQGNSALVDVLSCVGGWNEPGKPYIVKEHVSSVSSTTQPSDPVFSGHSDSDASIDRLDAPGQELATTVILPIGKTMLVGGMTVEPKVKLGNDATTQPKDNAGAEDERQLYLILRVDEE
jgi:hypothetical protein